MQGYKIYKAKVTNVSIPDNQGETQRKIYVSPYPPDGSGTWEKPANPPNIFPTNNFGSGLVSYPEVGQNCIVAEWKGHRQILAYMPSEGLSPYGGLIPDNLTEGAFRFGIKGLTEALIKMTKDGQVTIFSHMFAQMGINGSNSTAFIKSRQFTNDFAGGFVKSFYDDETKNTASVALYRNRKANPAFSDHALRIEESTGSPLPRPDYEYRDKAIIRSGFIEDGEHPWELQTRQNIDANRPQDKTVVSLLRMGYQKEHERYGSKDYPAGTMIELSAKKSKPSDLGVFKFRYGRIDSNSPKSQDKGEFLGLYAYEGMKYTTSPITDSLGEGKGWGVDYNPKSEQSFVHSVGRMPDKENSFERKLLKDKKEDFELLQVYGGENSAKTTIKHKKLKFLRVLSPENFSQEYKFENFGVKETIDKKWSVLYQEGSSEDQISIEKDKIKVLNDSSSEISVEGDKILIKNKSGDQIELSGGTITLKSGGTEIIIDKNKVSMETGPKDIILDQNGFRANGKKLIFESAIKAISNTPSISVSASPGSPAPIFPGLKAQLDLPIHRTSL